MLSNWSATTQWHVAYWLNGSSLIHFGCRQGLHMAPISANALFPPSLISVTFQFWTRKGVSLVRDFLREGNFTSFQQLRTKLNVSTFYQISASAPLCPKALFPFSPDSLKGISYKGRRCSLFMICYKKQHLPLWTISNSTPNCLQEPMRAVKV